ncbi:hypothetical protein C7974DRAFT_355603 [Boeremia exigua]|uniref:uncharacterized protein n=1 Tax=Boeremia exigua TaxID=749465 RepID=UPI001E8DE1EA|nr:uncharacterized protein C7974DRAFT_355603 [Boeremia exigua]KAH6637750.1 hypothetical protein C7974DRAFT_355603 [Boeremia exigua]
MLNERDPNTSGRTSRASNLSAASRATFRPNGGADKQDHLASAPGIMSMLRTSTEMGNVVGLTGDLSGLSNVPRGQRGRAGTSSRLSTASSVSGNSSRASKHHRQWPSSSSAPRRPSTREPAGPQYVADTLSPTVMDLPGSSPLIPTHHPGSYNNRDSQRSFSMTNTTQRAFRLSSNRSLGSLRSHELIQRSRSPYIYPTRLRRPSYRPASPALSDAASSRAQRLRSYDSQGQVQHQGQMRLRIPSDASLGYQDRASGMRRDHPSAYYNGLEEDIPPVPPLVYPVAPLRRPSAIQSPFKGKFRRGSIKKRNEPDTSSSDQPLPPTPRSGSMEVMLNTQVRVDTVSGRVVKETVPSVPRYYDYSEQFEREHLLEPEVNPIQADSVKQVRTAQEEHGSAQPTTPARGTWNSGTMQVSNAAVPDVAELPASPVPRRITRDMILEVLEAASTTVDVSDSGATIACDNDESLQHEGVAHRHVSTQAKTSGRHDGLDRRFSVLSQADSSVINSSTLDFAVRCSIPIVTGAQVGSGAPPMPDKDSPLPPDTAPNTDVDMSDLLAGYQHTDSRHGDGSVAKEDTQEPDIEPEKDRVVESRSSHAQKSSDPESFKSATDVLESEPSESSPANDDEAKSYRSGPGPSIQDADAHSFKTAQDLTTPRRSASRPVAKSSSVRLVEVLTPRPISEGPLSPPAPAVLRKTRVPRESSSLLAKFRASSKPGSAVSILGSSSPLSGSHQPPPVPPRESSTSKEAQRSMSVASWMLFKRWGKRTSKEEDQTKTSNSSRDTLRPVERAHSSQQSLGDTIKTPEKALFKETHVPTRADPPKDCAPSQVHNVGVTASSRQLSFNSSGPVPADPSSVYSSKDSSSTSRVQSSPAGVPKPVDNRRDSQTTTHLAWHGRRSLNLNNQAASISEPHLPFPSSGDDTTTDLRLSQYRYPAGLHHLPDLKEESHEDSSLNTSASNLKNSNFRFPFGVPGGVRASVDDGALFSRRSSAGSYRKSALGSSTMSQPHELPLMRFSRMDLFEKVDEVVRLRSSRSLAHVSVEVPEVHDDTPPRPASVGEMREKYRSFYDKLDGLNTPRGAVRTEMSPELMAEIEQMTVPSVNGLTDRITELLPSLKGYYKSGEEGPFVAEEMIMEHAMEDIHDVGGPAQKRSSARLRPLPGSPNMMVMDDALYDELTHKEGEGDVAVAQGDEGVGPAQGESRASVTKTSSLTRPKTHPAELETLSPTRLRPRATTGGHHDLRASVDLGLTTRSLRSFASTPTKTDTRPWNSDKNYPWATTTVPSVDISLPPSKTVRHSPRPGPSHLRNNVSDTSSVSTFVVLTPIPRPCEVGLEPSEDFRQLERFERLERTRGQYHEPGERYPTSACSPPTAIFRDHLLLSYTSDDEPELQVTRRSRLRERFSSARNATLDSTRATDQSPTSAHPLGLPSPESARRSAPSLLQDTAGEASAFTSNRHTFSDAQGMPSVVYHRNRLIDHLKRWWHKGGDLFRNLSHRSTSKTRR